MQVNLLNPRLSPLEFSFLVTTSATKKWKEFYFHKIKLTDKKETSLFSYFKCLFIRSFSWSFINLQNCYGLSFLLYVVVSLLRFSSYFWMDLVSKYKTLINGWKISYAVIYWNFINVSCVRTLFLWGRVGGGVLEYSDCSRLIWVRMGCKR